VSNLTLYNQHRQYIRTGDILLWRSSGIIGKAIQHFSKADVNHASLVIRFTEYDLDRIYQLEAVAHGIALTALSNRLANHSGECYWCGIKDIYESNRYSIGKEALSLVGTKYDYCSLFKQLLGRVSVDAQRLFCSEYIAYCWFNAGLPVNIMMAPRPGDMEKEFTHIIKPREKIL